MTQVLVIFGEHTGAEIRSAALRMQGQTTDMPWSSIEKCYFDPAQAQQTMQEIKNAYPGSYFHIGIADNLIRREAAIAAEAVGLKPATIIDPDAFIDSSATIEPGCFIAAHCVVSSKARLGRHCVVHFNSTVGHNSVVGEFSSILPGARLSGFVETESGVMIGSNAFIFQGVKIGRDAKIDALTYVREDVPERRVVSTRRS